MKKIVMIVMILVAIVAINVLGRIYFQSTFFPTDDVPIEQGSNDFILPDNVSTEKRRNDITSAYEQWKEQYLTKIEGQPDQYYVKYDNEGNTVSEAHGYGMLTMVMMAEQFGEKTKPYFDGMFHYAKDHPSDRNASLMVWRQYRQQDGTMMDDKSGRYTGSATDGDMDIAYALLQADKLWGNDGEINYKQEALTIINALMDSVVNQNEWTLKLGDWVKNDDPKYGSATRTSDWMVGHISVFYEVTGDERWKKVLDKMIDMATYLQDTYSPQTGLFPEFVWKKEGEWVPVDPNFLEGEKDPYYSYNACRVPWRLAAGYFITKDERVKHQLEKMNKWVGESTQYNPSAIKAGYELNGQAMVSFSDMAFIAPFAASSSIDGENQEWLNLLWERMTEESGPNKTSKYYSDSIRLLVMLFIEEAGEN